MPEVKEPEQSDNICSDHLFLPEEEGALAELLGELQCGDFARILPQLSAGAKDEIRAAIGRLLAEASYR